MSMYDVDGEERKKRVDRAAKMPKVNMDFLKKIAIPIAALVVVLLLIFVVIPTILPAPQVIDAKYEKTPLTAGENTLLILNINNLDEKDAKDVTVELNAIDVNSITVSPKSWDIAVIEKGLNKKRNFNVTTENNISAGKYAIEIEVKLNGKKYTKRAVLEIQ